MKISKMKLDDLWKMAGFERPVTECLPDSFAAACYDWNIIDDLRASHEPNDADETDCKNWELTPEQWAAQIEIALRYKEADDHETGERRRMT